MKRSIRGAIVIASIASTIGLLAGCGDRPAVAFAQGAVQSQQPESGPAVEASKNEGRPNHDAIGGKLDVYGKQNNKPSS
jgi:hypothetical protein